MAARHAGKKKAKKKVAKKAAKKPAKKAGKKPAKQKATRKAGKKVAKQRVVARAPQQKATPARQPIPSKPARSTAATTTTSTVRKIVPRAAPDRERTPVTDPIKALADAAVGVLHRRFDAPKTEPSTPAPQEPALASSGSDRREHLRVPYGAWVNLVRDGRQEFCLARDISMGGLFLKATPPPALGDQVQLMLVIENASAPLMLNGLVVRRSESEGGFGVRFTNLDGTVAARLRELVADSSAAMWKPSSGGPATPRDHS